MSSEQGENLLALHEMALEESRFHWCYSCMWWWADPGSWSDSQWLLSFLPNCPIQLTEVPCLGGWWWPCCGQVSYSAINYSSNTIVWSVPTVNKYFRRPNMLNLQKVQTVNEKSLNEENEMSPYSARPNFCCFFFFRGCWGFFCASTVWICSWYIWNLLS